MKCPFKKNIYEFVIDYNTKQTVVEDFDDCIEKECALWNKYQEICGLSSNYMIIEQQQNWRLP